MRRFLSELRRRKVYRTALIYVVGGYAAIEAADLLAPLLELPDWTARFVLGLVVVGFPLSIGLAWMFQISPEAAARTPPATGPEDSRNPSEPARGEEQSPTPVAPSGQVGPTADTRRSVLVAPIENQGLGPGDAYIADGLTDEIITDLSRIDSLRVISRASTMRLKKVDDPLATARDLDIDYMLDGSVRQSGDELRITLRLIHLDTGEALWSERYTGSLTELFKIHDNVSTSVADALAVRVGAASAQDERRRLDDPRAVESYLRARYETWKFTRTGLERAERHLLNGLEVVGPNLWLYAALGHVYAWYAQLGLDPDGVYLVKAAECADRVFELEPESSRGYRLRGMVRFQSGDLRAARAPLERSVAGSRNDPDTLLMLGYLSALTGQHQRALAHFAAAADIDPLTPLNIAMPGFVAILEGRFGDAVGYYRRYRDMDPHSPFALWCWIWTLLFNNQTDEASGVLAELTSRHGESLFATLGKAQVLGALGEWDAAREAVTDELRGAARTSELFSRELTHALALAGQPEEALDWLENTVRIGNVNHPFWSEHDPLIESLRDHPRFEALMTQVEREWRALNPELAG